MKSDDASLFARGMPATSVVRDAPLRRILDAIIQVLSYLLKSVKDLQKAAENAPKQQAKNTVELPVGFWAKIQSMIDGTKGDSGQTQEPTPDPNYTASGSVQISTKDISLVNDSSSPANSSYYGTDSSGAKGFHALSFNTLPDAPITEGAPVGGVVVWDGTKWVVQDFTSTVVTIVTSITWNGETLSYKTKDAYIVGTPGSEISHVIDTPVEDTNP